MEFRRFGSSGIEVSATGLGCNNFGGRIDFEASRRVVHKALDLGVTFFDTADAYGNRGGSEEYLGRILGPRRSDVVIATKFGLPMSDGAPERDASSRYIARAVEASLKRLNTDYIDLYQIHYPDPATPIEETVTALDQLVRQGKVRHIGCANFRVWELVDAMRTADSLGLTRFVSCQNEYSLLVADAEQEMLPMCANFRVGFVPYYPLAGGLLTGKYRRGAALPTGSRLTVNARMGERYLTERNWRLVERFEAFARSRGRALADLAFAYLLACDVIPSVIAGATSPDQIEANVAASSWRLTADDVAAIEALY
jgi:aryl-alcohol dehydrogenase-like predicted oxidoreductase